MEVFVKEELDDEVEKIPLSPLFAHYDDDEEGDNELFRWGNTI